MRKTQTIAVTTNLLLVRAITSVLFDIKWHFCKFACEERWTVLKGFRELRDWYNQSEVSAAAQLGELVCKDPRFLVHCTFFVVDDYSWSVTTDDEESIGETTVCFKCFDDIGSPACVQKDTCRPLRYFFCDAERYAFIRIQPCVERCLIFFEYD